MNIFLRIRGAVRRKLLERGAPYCQFCHRKSRLISADPEKTGKMHFWGCTACDVRWWGPKVGKPTAYAHHRELEERQKQRGREVFTRILKNSRTKRHDPR